MEHRPRVWHLRFEGMPPNLLNARLHHHTRARVVRHWRRRAWAAAALADIPPLGRARLSAVFTRRALHVADPDGDMARLKPLVDGLRDARVLSNDTRRCVEWGPLDEAHGPPGVTLVIEEVADAG